MDDNNDSILMILSDKSFMYSNLDCNDFISFNFSRLCL